MRLPCEGGSFGVLDVPMKDVDPHKEVLTHTGKQERSLQKDLELLNGRR